MALLSSAVAGLATMALTPYGVAGALAYVVIGLLNEVTFAVLRYRLWTRPVFFVSAAVSSVVYAAIFALFFNTDGQPLWQLLTMPVIMTVVVWLALLVILPLADKVAQTGAVRGLQGPIRR